MPRQSITLSPKNDRWLKDKANGDDFQNKSEVIAISNGSGPHWKKANKGIQA